MCQWLCSGWKTKIPAIRDWTTFPLASRISWTAVVWVVVLSRGGGSGRKRQSPAPVFAIPFAKRRYSRCCLVLDAERERHHRPEVREEPWAIRRPRACRCAHSDGHRDDGDQGDQRGAGQHSEEKYSFRGSFQGARNMWTRCPEPEATSRAMGLASAQPWA